MHKTLYIDIDEEITSIIDRVRKSEAREIILVAPKNALLLQGIVNLKLLKKEADRRKKQLLIITQDKMGKKLIEKAGILADTKSGDDLHLDEETGDKDAVYEPKYADEAQEIRKELQKKEEQEKEIGSSDYFDEPMTPKSEVIKEEKKEKTLAASAKKRKAEKSKVSMTDIIIGKARPKEKKVKKTELPQREPEADFTTDESDSFSPPYAVSSPETSNASRVSIKKAEKFFRGSRRLKRDFETAKVGGSAKKYFAMFAGIFVLVSALSAAYFLLPKATLALDVRNKEEPLSFELTADSRVSSVNASDKTLPANFEQITKETTEEFAATGATSGGSKATGQVVIYNEFSSEDQPLVATTRLETSDGKIFRITKDVVVPGIAKVGNEEKPGVIEADVVADQPGESFNIGPADFKIVGFKDTPSKYEKFSAKSAKAMTGGSAGDAKAVSAQDIAAVKEKITAGAKKAAVEELKKNIPLDSRIFDDAVRAEVLNVSASESAGAEKEKFSATAKIRISALSFRETDVKEILKKSLAQDGTGADAVSFDKPINYLLVDFDLEQKTLKFQTKADIETGSGLNLENFKKGLLGKTAADAQAYAKNFPVIQKMDISLWPFFVTRIPMSEGRVEVEVR